MNYLSILTNDLWAMEPSAMERLAAQLSDPIAVAAASRMETRAGDGTDEPGYQVKDGIAHIPVSGVLMKEVPRALRHFGVNATAYGDISAALDDADADPNVSAIMLDVDSPGGEVAGIHSLADRVFQNQTPGRKPVHAHIDTMGASAAYWLASQAKTVTATRGAQVGSIGVYTMRIDSTRADEAAGVKVHLFSSGPHKGAGVPGTALTDTQKAEIQSNIEAKAAIFVADVVRGRGKGISSQDLTTSTDGRVFLAEDAKARGLIDSVTSTPTKGITMAISDAAKNAFLLEAFALAAKEPKHMGLIKSFADGVVASGALAEGDIAGHIARVRGDIAIAEKSAQEAAAKAELEGKVAKITSELESERAAHIATKSNLSSVERERDALATLARGAAPAAAVKSEPAPKTVKHHSQALVAAMQPGERAEVMKACAKGDAVIDD